MSTHVQNPDLIVDASLDEKEGDDDDDASNSWRPVECVQFSGSSSDAMFLKKKKPASVADKNIKMNLRGHIFFALHTRSESEWERQRCGCGLVLYHPGIRLTLCRPGIGLISWALFECFTRTANVEMAKAALFVFRALYRWLCLRTKKQWLNKNSRDSTIKPTLAQLVERRTVVGYKPVRYP